MCLIELTPVKGCIIARFILILDFFFPFPEANFPIVRKAKLSPSLLSGFEGHNCEINIDDCPDHMCMNGGTCVDGVNTYNCQCPPEWTGTEKQGKN